MIRIATILTTTIFLFSLLESNVQSQEVQTDEASLIDQYIDSRFEAKNGATEQLLKKLAEMKVDSMTELESRLRAKRSKYPDPSKWLGKQTKHAVSCYHVDYDSHFLMFIPKDIDLKVPVPVVIVGHGGNSSMTPGRAERTANIYLQIYSRGLCKKMKAVIVAPVSSRGWGHIGNSLILSTLSKLKRMLPVDPDRIYITGQSMGGHLSYRSALNLPDRWGAVSPHSGGYDYVKKKSIGNLINVPGFAIWGIREPYGINKDNRTNEKWANNHKLDWKFVQKNGGHTIYEDELENVANFFKKHPRDLYRKTVFLRQGGPMKFIKTWGIKGWPEHKVHSKMRPLRWNLRHWIEVQPRPELKEPFTLLATNKGDNQFQIQSKNVRKLKIFLHPKMIDFKRPVSVLVNGKEVYNKKVVSDPKIMFNMAREFDDRGRIFWAQIELEISTDQEVNLKKAEP